jgi:hypothetical protein
MSTTFTGSSRGNSLLQNLQGKAAYRDPKWSDPSLDPAQSGRFMHRAALFSCFYNYRTAVTISFMCEFSFKEWVIL